MMSHTYLSNTIATEDTHRSPTLNGQVRADHAADMSKHMKKNKNKVTKFDRFYSEHGATSKPDHKRIDYVLVHSTDIDEDKKIMRETFENTLTQKEGFSIKEVTVGENVFKELNCPFKRHCIEAEKVKLEMPLIEKEKDQNETEAETPKEKEKNETEAKTPKEKQKKENEAKTPRKCDTTPPEETCCPESWCSLYTWITTLLCFLTDTKEDNTSAPFKMDNIKWFKGSDNPTTFFRPSVRSFLTHHILTNIDIEEAEKKEVAQDNPGCISAWCRKLGHVFGACSAGLHYVYSQDKGLQYLQMKNVYEDAFVLHEESNEEKDEDSNEEKDNDRKKTDKGSDEKDLIKDPRKKMKLTWKSKLPPLRKIRNYFGEKIGLYFAWAGLLMTSLWFPMLFGLACFIYGLTLSVARSQENYQIPANLTAQEQFRLQLKDLYETVRDAFDNDATPAFAFVICLWGTIFLEFWKRQENSLAYKWHVENYEANERKRPEFFGTTKKKDSATGKYEPFFPTKRHIMRVLLSLAGIMFMVSLVLISVIAVVIYRVIISFDLCGSMTTNECLVATTVVSGLLNAVSVLLLGKAYKRLAKILTDFENHPNQTQYDDALIFKLFAFQFVNSYAACFYIAFFRGRFDELGVFGLGEKFSDTCAAGNCMSELSLQVLFLMSTEPIFKFFIDIIKPYLLKLWNKRRNKVGVSMEFLQRESMEFLQRESPKPELGDFTLEEYTEKIILYGFLMLFAASAPLAPFIAMLWLAIDLRIDVYRLLWINKRPVAFIAQDIGMWYELLYFVNLVGVISNGFLIAFTSQWGLQYDLVDRFWICIGFEHIVFAMKYLFAYMIPDVPGDVKQAIRKKKYLKTLQRFKKLENKYHDCNYTELVPETTHNFKHENSSNYSKFNDPLIDQEAPDMTSDTNSSRRSKKDPSKKLETMIEIEGAPDTQTVC